MKRKRFAALGLLLAAGAGCQSAVPDIDPALFQTSPVIRSQKPDNDGAKVVAPTLDTQAKTPAAATTDSNAAKPIQTMSFLDIRPEATNGDKDFVATRIRATVGKSIILDDEVMNYMAPRLEAMRRSGKEAEIAHAYVTIFNETLDLLIDREVVVQAATKQLSGGGKETLRRLEEAADKEFDRQLRQMRTALKMNTDEEFNKFLKDRGGSLENLRRTREHEFIFREYLNYRIRPLMDQEVCHQAIVQYYRTHPEEFQVPDSVKWQDLFLLDYAKYPTPAAARTFAEGLAERVRRGEDFGKLADEFDCGTSRGAHGEGEGKLRGDVRPPEAEKTLFEMQDGQMAVLVMPNGGVHLMRLVKRQHAGMLPLSDEKVQKQVSDKLRMEIYERESKRIIEELRRQVPIEIARNTD